MDIKAHWQAIYDQARASMNAGGFTDVELLHIDSENGINSEEITFPFVTYRDETENTLGTTGAGSLKVTRSGWLFSVRSEDFSEALDIASSILNGLVDSDLVTADGYETTAIDLIGRMSLWEPDAEVYAAHLRFSWERSI